MKQRKGFDSMRAITLQTLAVTLGLGVCTVAQAQSPYTSPSKWNNFRTISDSTEAIPAPAAELPVPSHQYAPPATPAVSSSASVGTGCAPCESSADSASPFSQAMSSSWGGSCGDGSCGTLARPELSPWFGSANLLFYTLESGRGRSMISGDIFNGAVRSSVVDADSSLGFDIGAGRYFGCGQYGLGLNYMNWNPGSETFTENRDAAGVPIAAGGGLRADNIHYNRISADINGGGAQTVYDIIDGSSGAPYLGATGIRLTRDMSFQGIEANLFNFGLMGASRAAYAGCAPGYGGAAGPMIRGNSGKLRIMNSHGFRWFQVKDDFEAAFNVDAAAGYGNEDLYDNVEIENNLFGYQFGSMLNYCLTGRLNANLGAKFGIYGNHVDYRHRLGTLDELAYTNADGAGVGDIDVESSDTVLAGLGEIDFGLGYRISNRWSVRGGYRLMAVTGVANAVNNMQDTDYGDITLVSNFDANDSLILHGGYIGLTCNW